MTPLTCGASNNQTFLEIKHLDSFNFVVHLEDVDVERCKDVCANNCSCKATFYQVSRNSSKTWCFFASELFSLVDTEESISEVEKNVTAYIKVQKSPRKLSTRPPHVNGRHQNRKMDSVHMVLGSVSGAAVIAAVFVALFILWRKNQKYHKSEEAFTEHIPGLPVRFTYAELEQVTERFSKKLGMGGFSSVYEGTIHDGTKVAVKHMDGFSRTEKSFLAEVEVIGSIHHTNLVRLMGFCADSSSRLLVYEYMANGSLEKWIFEKSDGCMPLKWEQRRNIILDVAKGLRYLHEECTQKIIHFDVKPQNILLDGKFRAKVADFGLSKSIDRDRSRVVTVIKGTPGYLAPEWLRGTITEKVDVYGFGMVILEVVCGRKVYNHNDEDETDGSVLLDLLKSKLVEGCLLDMVNEKVEDVDATSVSRMLKLAAWCLQVDSSKRPSMSTAIKVLEGVHDIPEDCLKHNFFSGTEAIYNFKLPSSLRNGRFGVMFNVQLADDAEVGASRLSADILSGPR
ncbi:hypothetical protein MLD38_022666 [Melastoma candidum]|nr:hypothetical protein MLD38_022666 [Melastoma candidum]